MRAAALIVLIGLAAAVLAAAHVALHQSPQLPREYFLPLMAANIVLLIALAAAAVFRVWALARRLRRGMFGARLSLRLGMLFAVAAALPTLVVYAASVGSIFRSIESWFDIPLQHALDQGLALSQTLVGRTVNHLEDVAFHVGDQLAVQGESQFQLDDLRVTHQLAEIAVFSRDGRLVARSAEEGAAPLAGLPPAALEALREGRLYLDVSDVDGAPKEVEVVAPAALASFGDNFRAVRVRGKIPAAIAEQMDALRRGRRDYRQLSDLRRGLRWSFILTLSFTALATILAAASLALWLGERLSAPLSRLAAATRAVARGDFSRRERARGRDELADLARGFNRMTAALRRAQSVARAREAEIAAANSYLETLLANVSSGVLALGADSRLARANDGARRLLGAGAVAAMAGKRPAEWADGADPAVAAIKAALVDALAHSGEFEREARDAAGRVWLLRGRALPGGVGYIAVVDDISRQLQAAREATWEEAGRRFAHEIKNPLTPVQLAAERLRARLKDKLDPADAGALEKATVTIVNQVGAMKQMVDAFRAYAAPARAVKKRVDLNALAEEVGSLYHGGGIRVAVRAAAGGLRAAADEVAVRQILHNLLVNAKTAASGRGGGAIDIRLARADNRAVFSIQDDGGGMPDEMIGRAFEPYITTKRGGAGLGLAVVKKLVDELGGEIALTNADGGMRAVVSLPLADGESQAENSDC